MKSGFPIPIHTVNFYRILSSYSTNRIFSLLFTYTIILIVMVYIKSIFSVHQKLNKISFEIHNKISNFFMNQNAVPVQFITGQP